MADKKIQLRELFDEFNSKTGNRLTCKKIYIVPAMRFWIDDTEEEDEVVIATLSLEDNPFTIKKICFNPDLTNEEMIEILKKYLAQSLVLGENWKDYVTYRATDIKSKEEIK